MIDDAFADERFTAMGLLMEVHAGISATYKPELEALGLSGPAFEVLLRLARSPGRRLRMTELAGQSTLTNSGLTRLVDRLERAELVRREPCPDDGRGFYAVLNDAGYERLTAAVPRHLATVDRIFTGVLDADELEVMLKALRKIRAVVKPDSDPANVARR